IVVANPARPERGRIRVGDEAGLVWETGRRGADRTDPALSPARSSPCWLKTSRTATSSAVSWPGSADAAGPPDSRRNPFMTGRTGTRSREGGARLAPGGTGAVAGPAAPVLTRRPRKSAAPVPVPLTVDRGPTMARHWPVRDYLELGALPGAVPCAR